jgi:hypothetical protein
MPSSFNVSTSYPSGGSKSQPAIIANRQEKMLNESAPKVVKPDQSYVKKQQMLSHAKNTGEKQASQPAGQNISSEATEKKEVASIASELKKNLKKTTPLQNHPPVPKGEGEIKLQPKRGGELAGDEDTIYIDREGNFHQKDN